MAMKLVGFQPDGICKGTVKDEHAKMVVVCSVKGNYKYKIVFSKRKNYKALLFVNFFIKNLRKQFF